MDNKKEFDALIIKYESITIDDILKDAYCKNITIAMIAKKLTGYGSTNSCTLCIAIGLISLRSNCKDCEWVKLTGEKCYLSINEDTYVAVFQAKTYGELLEAFRNRAKYMREVRGY